MPSFASDNSEAESSSEIVEVESNKMEGQLFGRCYERAMALAQRNAVLEAEKMEYSNKLVAMEAKVASLERQLRIKQVSEAYKAWLEHFWWKCTREELARMGYVLWVGLRRAGEIQGSRLAN